MLDTDAIDWKVRFGASVAAHGRMPESFGRFPTLTRASTHLLKEQAQTLSTPKERVVQRRDWELAVSTPSNGLRLRPSNMSSIGGLGVCEAHRCRSLVP